MRRPKFKSSVENAIGILEKGIFHDLGERRYFTLEQFNEDLCGGKCPAGNRGPGSSQNTASDVQTPSESGEETPAPIPDVSVSEPDNVPEGSEKILMAYFSVTNNTEGVVQKLADGLGADLYEITPEQPYTDKDLDYGNSESCSSVEMDDPSARPAISGSVENMEQYNIVFIGSPNWWGVHPHADCVFSGGIRFFRQNNHSVLLPRKRTLRAKPA